MTSNTLVDALRALERAIAETGGKLEGVAVAPQTPRSAPTFPMEKPQERAQPEGFEEWFRAKVGSGKQVMISYRGDEDLGAKEIQKLIDMLAAQKAALED